MERSGIPGWPNADFAALHPGYQAARTLALSGADRTLSRADRTALISLGIPKLVRFAKSGTNTPDGIFIP
jgi:hypothetical protein